MPKLSACIRKTFEIFWSIEGFAALDSPNILKEKCFWGRNGKHGELQVRH